jgi:hypothetical protein
MEKETSYFNYEDLPTIPQDVTPVNTHLDKQLEYIKEKGILVEEDQLNRMVTNKLYDESTARVEKVTSYFIDSSPSLGFIINKSSIERKESLLIRSKEKASLIANKLNLYQDMLVRAYELGYDPNVSLHNKSVYGLRYNFDVDPEGKVYVTSHSQLQVFIFGIVFTNEFACEILLDEFKDRIKLYY